jgi:serine/threonine protein kinase
LFIAYDAIDIASHIRLVGRDSGPEFDRWLELKRSIRSIDFRRIQRVGFGLPCLKDYIVNLSAFDERLLIGKSHDAPNPIYHRLEDECLIVVKSIPCSDCVEKSGMENEIENLINLRHPCISNPIGFVFPVESGSWQELKIVRLYLEGCSLSEVVSMNPSWWTSTVKAKVIAGIVLGLRFAHSLGLIHGDLTANKIVFDSDHCIQIVEFKPIELKVGESEDEEEPQLGGFSRARWTPMMDVRGFASILFELVVGRPAKDEISVPRDIRRFVCEITEKGLWLKSVREFTFHDIFEILKQNKFQIEDGVDSKEVSAFVSWVESTESPQK